MKVAKGVGAAQVGFGRHPLPLAPRTMSSTPFWDFFETLRPQLGARAASFALAFQHLDQFDRPVTIVETGCVRQAGNWGGDGGSTILFDRYAQARPGSRVYTVDLSPDATAVCRTLVSTGVTVHTGDSVQFLRGLADAPPEGFAGVDLLYLDSYDVNFADPFPSAMHHMKELVAAAPMLRADTLVLLDDSPSTFTGFVAAAGQLTLVGTPAIGGKGKFVAEYAAHVGAALVHQGYQCAWTGFRAGGRPAGTP